MYEIFLAEKSVTADAWQRLFWNLATLSHPLAHWRIFTAESHAKLHFYLEATLLLPANLDQAPEFFLQILDANIPLPTPQHLRFYPTPPAESLFQLRNYFTIKKQTEFLSLQISFQKFAHRFVARPTAILMKGNRILACPLVVASPAHLLTIDFTAQRHLLQKSTPKYLDVQKFLPFLSRSRESALLQIETFPYQTSHHFLNPETLDFAKHTLVLGASGSGKSKFLSLFIEKLATNPAFKQKYKIVVIDPHAALENDVGVYARTIDFLHDDDSIQLFDDTARDPVVATELILELLKSLLADNFNPKIARVLRHAISILICLGQFNFQNLGHLLLDLEFRNQILQNRDLLPQNSLEFFLTEYNEIKTHFYTEAISPIISLIDEVEMIPVLRNSGASAPDLKATISEHFLTLFSLDRTKLGDRATAIISGIIMQQLFTLVQNRTFSEHVIFIIDEVAVVENPILKRFLAEARKFNLSLILAGQYFGAISTELRTAIFANTTNYYIFRVARDDANLLTTSLDFKIPLADTKDRKIKTLTDLQNRECVARVSCAGELLPAAKGRTLDFTPKPRLKTPYRSTTTNSTSTSQQIFQFSTKTAMRFQTFLTGSKYPRRLMTEPFENRLGRFHEP